MCSNRLIWVVGGSKQAAITTGDSTFYGLLLRNVTERCCSICYMLKLQIELSAHCFFFKLKDVFLIITMQKIMDGQSYGT